MERSLLGRSLLALIMLCSFSYSLAQGAQVNRLVVFGDSYSDNGNVFKLTQGQSPNPVRYYEGRYSNGPVWSEYLADNFRLDPRNHKQFIDYAYGNAKIDETVVITMQNPTHHYQIPALSQQIKFFQKQYQKFSDSDLVVVFISANDVYDLAKNEQVFRKLASAQTKQLQRLINLGAKHIIVLNGRDVSYAPLTTVLAMKNISPKNKQALTEYKQNFRQLIQTYNQQLAAELRAIPQIFLYDIFQFDTHNMTAVKHHGLTYTMQGTQYIINESTDPCYQNLQGDYQGIAGPVCNNPQNYYFYDRIHTTQAVNYLLARDVYDQYQTATH